MTIFMKQYTIVLTYSPCSSYPERKMLESKRMQKYDERKEFDASMLRHLSAVERQSSQPLIWAGDLNVTPSLVHDVFDGSSNPSRDLYPGNKSWERSNCELILRTLRLYDAYRYLHPQPDPTVDFTYFGRNSWADRHGQRLDHLMCSSVLLDVNSPTIHL